MPSRATLPTAAAAGWLAALAGHVGSALIARPGD
jgi:hypothetical protein